MGDDWVRAPLRVKVRLDFYITCKGKKLFFGNNNIEQQAEENRDRQVALIRNVPIQGIFFEDVDTNSEVFILRDEMTGQETAFAPVLITLRADSLEDLLRFIMRDEFRKIEVLEPEQFLLNRFELERLFFRIHEEQKRFLAMLERKISNR